MLFIFLISFGFNKFTWAECQGKLPNFISDICWTCMFPLSIGKYTIKSNNQLDNPTQTSFFCNCKFPAWSGINFGFWEPVRIVEVTRTPFCLVSLGGIQMNPGFKAKEPGARTRSAGSFGTTSNAFYHVHWYTNPLLHWLGVLLDFECIERDGFDLQYLSELDPTWDDDQLASIITPEHALSANLAGVSACAADCISQTANFSSNLFWWCAGCVGNLFPMSGNVAAHISGRQSSALLAARIAMKLHRIKGEHYTHGYQSACGSGFYSAKIIKDVYKMSMIYPKAQGKINRRCCEAFGESPEIWARNSEWPVTGEDFSYLLFRKRDCCESITKP